MLRLAIAVAVIGLFVSACKSEAPCDPPAALLASKCTGQDPCHACKNCHNCGHCKHGGSCGTCKPKKKLLATHVCR